MAGLELLAAALLSATPIVPIGGGNALTLPAQRHLVRMDEPGGAVWLLAVQKDWADGNGLVFYRSDDEGNSWDFMAPIQDDASERDEADLLQVGQDVALVYSYEGPDLTASTRHDVYFQWWRWQSGSRTFAPQAPVKIFDSTSGTSAYSRAELAVDSNGRIWVQAFSLLSDGNSNNLVIAVSSNGGTSFTIEPNLATTSHRGGGRILSLGNRLMVIWAMHDGFQGTHFRIRNDSDPLNTWGPTQEAFPEGIYHGAALSAVATPEGGVQLAYKDENDEMLYLRTFDGSSFGPRTRLDGSSDWALQPAITAIGDDLVIFYDHVYTVGYSYDFRYRTWHNGSLGSAHILDGSGDFKGYPAAVDRLAPGFPTVPCFYGETDNAGVGGDAVLDTIDNPFGAAPPPPPDAGPPDAGPPDAGPPPPPPDAGPPDAGPPPPVDAGPPDAGPPPPVDAGPPDAGPPPPVDAGPPDAGRADAGPPDAGPVDAGSPDAGGVETLIFSDDFTTNIQPDDGLGAKWSLPSGYWYVDSKMAISDLDGADQATENVVTCQNCRVQSALVGFGVPEVGIFARAPSATSTDRYEAVIASNGNVRIQRVRSGTTTLLGQAASHISDLTELATLSLTVSGTSPVQLTATVNGTPVLSAADSSAQALTAAGYAGLWTTNAGVVWEAFRLYREP
ncbi:MAG: hypothetical protein JST54_32005 [Deltaproteobacteria bacterium]|nr:hypothetical protein [Deltaproteobacteria bacterium]